MDLPTSFGYWVRRRRKALDLTQVDLAQRVGCAKVTIQKIEADERRPSAQIAELLAEHLHIPPAERSTFLQRARGELAVDQLPESAPDGGHIPNPPAMVATDAPAVRPPTAAPTRRSHLPTQPTPLVGRVRELADLARLLDEPHIRLISITGPGGMGKTRLAIALAERLFTTERYLDGVYFVALAPLNAPEQIVPALAEALDFPLDAGKQRVRSPRQQVLDYLREKRLLLVLDNVEHLLGNADAGAGAADLIAALLAAAPRVAIVATSRERLKLREEHRYPLGGLDMPGTEAPSSYSAVALFVQRARSLRPDFVPEEDDLSVVAQICRLVDGMPLAIELAAGWVDTLAPSDIAAEIEHGLDLLATELHDVPARHRSMRAVFDTSYQRLSTAEQAVFTRLSIFRGGGTFQALQAITRAILPQLQALIGASLLSYDAGRGRYTLHELLWQYRLEKLAAAPGDELRTRDQHAAYYCAFVQHHGAELSGFDQQAALAALDAERENMRAAWAWAAKGARVDLLARAVDGLGYFYEWHAYFDDGEQAYHNAAAQLEAQLANGETIRVLAMIRAWQGNFRRLQGDIAGAEQLLRQSLALLERSPAAYDTRAERAFVLLQLGLVASEGPLEDARHYLEASLTLYQALGRRWEASHVLLWLGDLARYQGAFAEARHHFRASLAIRTACGDRRGVAEVLIWDSHVAADIGQVDKAEALARQSYALQEEPGDSANRAFGLGELAIMLMYAGKYDEACSVLRQSLDLYQNLGNRAMSVYAQSWLAVAFLATGQYETARTLSQQATARARELRGAKSGLAFMLHYAGWVELALGAYREAEALLQESVVLHQQSGNAGLLGWPLAQLGYTHWLLDDRPRAQAELLEVIQTAVKQHAFLPLLLALPAIALMLAEQGHTERAVELYALAWRHPLLANAQNFIDSFGQRLDAVVAALPPSTAAAAQARGRLMDLWETAAALDTEVSALGWDGMADA